MRSDLKEAAEFEVVTGVGLYLDRAALVMDRYGKLQTDATSLLDIQFGLGQRHFRVGPGLYRLKDLDTHVSDLLALHPFAGVHLV
jgi:hypothetical protein